MMDTIDRIINLLNKKGIKDKQFSDDLSLGKDKLSEWKKKKTKSYTKYIYQIAEYLDTSVAYLMCETDDPTPANKKEAPEAYPGQREKVNIIVNSANEFNETDIDKIIDYIAFVKSQSKQ